MSLASEKRGFDVLYAVITDYIASAAPVGSAQVSRHGHIDYSPATIRNIMAELEHQGYLCRTHASSGRLPTAKGFKLYVQLLMHKKPLGEALRHRLRERIVQSMDERAPLELGCQALSEATHQASVALDLKLEVQTLDHLEFRRIGEKRILLILVARNGLVQNQVLHSSSDHRQSDLAQMNAYIAQQLESPLSLSQLRDRILTDLERAKDNYAFILKDLMVLSENAQNKSEASLYVSGQSHLLSAPELTDISQMQNILKFLEEKTALLHMLEHCSHHSGVHIFVGEEVEEADVEGLALITAPYSDHKGNFGVLGILGPTRIDYEGIVPLIEYTSKIMTDTYTGDADGTRQL